MKFIGKTKEIQEKEKIAIDLQPEKTKAQEIMRKACYGFNSRSNSRRPSAVDEKCSLRVAEKINIEDWTQSKLLSLKNSCLT